MKVIVESSQNQLTATFCHLFKRESGYLNAYFHLQVKLLKFNSKVLHIVLFLSSEIFSLLLINEWKEILAG